MFTRFNKRNLKCSICGRTFNEHDCDHLCRECFEIAGIDNMVNDSGGTEWTADYALEVGKYLAAIAKKGGDVQAVKDSNDFIDWSTVPTLVSGTKVGGNTKATNGVKAPVRCNGLTYRSVRHAFEQLGLPMSKHQKFRIELKTKGEAFFSDSGQDFYFQSAGRF